MIDRMSLVKLNENPVYASSDTSKRTPLFEDVYSGLDLCGRDLGPMISGVKTWQECRTRCLDDQDCKSFTHDSKESNCWKKVHPKSALHASQTKLTGGLTSDRGPDCVQNGKIHLTQSETTSGFKYSNTLTTKIATYSVPSRERDFGTLTSLDTNPQRFGMYTVGNDQTPSYQLFNIVTHSSIRNALNSCPDIGNKSGGIIERVYDRNFYLSQWAVDMICNYQDIDSSKVTNFADLGNYFSGQQLVNAGLSWCMDYASKSQSSSLTEAERKFDAINEQSSNYCKNSLANFGGASYDWLNWLAQLVPNTWYDSDGWCRRLLSIARQSLNQQISGINTIINLINNVPNTGLTSAQMSRVVSTFNKILRYSSDNRVDPNILEAVRVKIDTGFCSATNSGTNTNTSCACVNAVRGWNTLATSGQYTGACNPASGPIPVGCEDVNSWAKLTDAMDLFQNSPEITAEDRKRILDEAGASGIEVIRSFATMTYDPFTMTGACRIARDQSDPNNPNFNGTTFMPKQIPTQESVFNLQVCQQVKNIFNKSTMVIGGDANFTCENNLVTNYSGTLGKSGASIEIDESGTTETSLTSPDGSSLEVGQGVPPGVLPPPPPPPPPPSPSPASDNSWWIWFGIAFVVCLVSMGLGLVLLSAFSSKKK